MTRQTAFILAPLLMACAALVPSAAAGGSYGMDPVPNAVFYRGAWDRYGSDPVPDTATSDLGFHSTYGLDAIPEAIIPTLHDPRYVLPRKMLQVLTGALQDGAIDEPLRESEPERGTIEQQPAPVRRRLCN
jgi:hypothetical protein